MKNPQTRSFDPLSRRSPRIVAVSALLVVGLVQCVGSHDPDIRAVRTDDCVLCHESEFLAAVDPPHQSILPPDCVICHSTIAWEPATFTHEAVAAQPCVLCHRNDYETTANPVHAGMFPTNCEDCHGTDNWRPALSGNHPENRFPIANGAHEKVDCLGCHDLDRGSSAAGTNTDCIGCHTGEHAMNRVNDQHKGVRDYAFDAATPNFCLVCHPNGQQ